MSEAERRTGEAAGIEADWSVVHNGVDTARFANDGPPRNPAPTVVCVGRLCRQKGQDVLLAAWPAVLAEVPAARLVLVGDGPDAEALRAAAGPRCGSPGPSGTPPLVPGRRRGRPAVPLEGMALAPLEAMAGGRPVVVSDVDGARESLPPAHEPLCLVPPEDPAALAAALGRLLGRPELRHRLGREAHEHVLSSFDVRRTGAAVADLYRELAGVRGPSTESRSHSDHGKHQRPSRRAPGPRRARAGPSASPPSRRPAAPPVGSRRRAGAAPGPARGPARHRSWRSTPWRSSRPPRC